MKQKFLIAVVALILAGAHASLAQDTSTTTGDSGYPPSNQPNAAPSEPDTKPGSAGATHKLPATLVGNAKTTVYDPTAPDANGKPAAPSVSDVTGSPNSGNTGILIPAPASVGKR